MENLVLSKNILEQPIITFNFGLYSGITTNAFGSCQLNGQNEETQNYHLAEHVKTKYFCKIIPEHSDRLVIINSFDAQNYHKGDALIFQQRFSLNGKFNPLLLSNTADCPIVLLRDTRNKYIALIHSGWRGTAKNIVSKTIRKILYISLRERYTRELTVANLHAFVWPGICSNCYKVDSNMEKYFPNRIINGTLDLKSIILDQLRVAGVTNIISTNLCSFHSQIDSEYLFHSHRRNPSGLRNCVFLST